MVFSQSQKQHKSQNRSQRCFLQSLLQTSSSNTIALDGKSANPLRRYHATRRDRHWRTSMLSATTELDGFDWNQRFISAFRLSRVLENNPPRVDISCHLPTHAKVFVYPFPFFPIRTFSYTQRHRYEHDLQYAVSPHMSLSIDSFTHGFLLPKHILDEPISLRRPKSGSCKPLKTNVSRTLNPTPSPY